MLVYPFSEAKSVLEGCIDIAASMPDDLTVQLGFVTGPDGAPLVLVVPTWCGPPGQGDAQVAPLLRLGTVLDNSLDAIRYGASLAALDAYVVNGQRSLIETCWLPALDSRSIDVFIEAMETAVSPGCAVFTHEFRGAASRVAPEATAFSLRRNHLLVEILVGVTTTTRSQTLPDVPAIGDFLPGYEASGITGFGAPKGTPVDIIDTLNKEVNAGLADPKIKTRLAELGAMALAGSPVDFGMLIANETEKWGKVVHPAP